MKFSVGFICLFFTLIPVDASATKKTGFSAPVTYEGGTLPLNQGKLKVTISGNDVVFLHGNRMVSVPLKNITAISYSTDSRRRFGASVLAVVPMMHLDTAQQHFIGLSWTGGAQQSKSEAVLKLSNAEYLEVLTLLELRTGRKATDTHEVPTVVQYGL